MYYFRIASIRVCIIPACLFPLCNPGVDKQTRSTTIITAKKWVPDNAYITAKVESFAFESISKLRNYVPEEIEQKNQDMGAITLTTDDNVEVIERRDATLLDKEEEAGSNENNQNDSPSAPEEDTYIIRHLELFFALTSRKHDLLAKY
jgi:hypothetical protein